MKPFLLVFILTFSTSVFSQSQPIIPIPARLFKVTEFYQTEYNSAFDSYHVGVNGDLFVIVANDSDLTVENITMQSFCGDSAIAAYELRLHNVSKLDSMSASEIFARRGRPFAQLRTFTTNLSLIPNSRVYSSQDTLVNHITGSPELALSLPKRTLFHIRRINHAVNDAGVSLFAGIFLIQRKND